jgi:hypothetical protein
MADEQYDDALPVKRKRGGQPGNLNGKTHGAEATVPADRLSEKAQEVYAVLAEDAPVRDGGGLPRHDREAVALLARSLCRLDDVTDWLDTHGVFNKRGRLRDRILVQEERLRNEVAKHLDALGMTPRSRAKLGVDLARTADLAQAMSEPDPQKRARLLRDAGLADDGDIIDA